METDWFVPLVREAHPDVPHAEARRAVARVWAVVREQAALAGVPVAEADEASVRRRLGLPGTVGEASVPAPGAADADAAVLLTALRVIQAAARAYGG